MIWSGFALGLLMSFHCVGMCGPIAMMLPVDRSSKSKALFQTLIYHLGRTFAYALLGLLFGWFGKGLYLAGFQQRLTILVGLFMIITAVLSFTNSGIDFLAKPMHILLSKVKRNMGLMLKKQHSKTLFFIGFFNGFLPCGLVYTAIFGALAMGSVEEGGLYMILFGIGTMPLMTVAVFLGNFLKQKQLKFFRKAFPIFVFTVGLLFVLRGLGLGIPYISPSDASLQISSNSMSCPAVLN